ncbi:hypothetical protein Q7P37_000257 [Cladosporium fusiforme]
MQALLLNKQQRTTTVAEVDRPAPASNEISIRVKAVALNPVDALYVRHPLGESGRVIGSDFSGVVEKIGHSVPASAAITTGSRVAGFLQGACSINNRPGAFAETVVCPWDLVWKIGELPFQQAAAVSLCALTAAQALYCRLRLPKPESFPSTENKCDSLSGSEITVLINGASSSVGLYAAQLVRLSSCKHITLIGTSSERHFPMLKGEPYRYDYLIDYHVPDWPERVVTRTKHSGVDISFDCISEDSTVVKTIACLKGTTLATNAGNKPAVAVVRSRAGGAWQGSAEELAGVEPSYGAVWEGLGVDVEYQGMSLPANAELRNFSAAFYKWLSQGVYLVPNPIREMPGGLARISEDGFKLLGTGSMQERKAMEPNGHLRPITGEKLVYILD